MLSNVLALLVHWTRSRVKASSDTPVFYAYSAGKDSYQIIVQRIPDREQAVA